MKSIENIRMHPTKHTKPGSTFFNVIAEAKIESIVSVGEGFYKINYSIKDPLGEEWVLWTKTNTEDLFRLQVEHGSKKISDLIGEPLLIEYEFHIALKLKRIGFPNGQKKFQKKP